MLVCKTARPQTQREKVETPATITYPQHDPTESYRKFLGSMKPCPAKSHRNSTFVPPTINVVAGCITLLPRIENRVSLISQNCLYTDAPLQTLHVTTRG